ncbi:MAG: penicillin acylase family protein [Alphaproteobacteria bacterium]
MATAAFGIQLSGNRTVTGKPLMANDPHLGFRAPGLWYLARIQAPDLNVTGATVPGVPFHILGHNGDIAWSFTTTDSDTQDLFLERKTGRGSDTYETPVGPQKYDIRTEEIAVRGHPPEKMTIRVSRHGPVISDVYPRLRRNNDEKYDVALAAAGLRADDLTPLALMRLNKARNWDDFVGALQTFHAPQQNISYADRRGNIGLYAPGRIPVRRSGKGTPGWDGTHDWRGFIPYDALPRAYNPATGALINANHRLVPTSYPWYLTDDWSAPYRAQRLHQLLAPGIPQSADSFRRSQNDAVSLAATELMPLFLEKLGRQTGASKEIAALLAEWNGAMSRTRPEPLVFSMWLYEINRAMYQDELGPLFERYYGQRPRAIAHMLTRRQVWCDDTRTPERESCGDIVTGAFASAISALSEKYGDDYQHWRWGTAHEATFAHPLFGRIPVLRQLADIRIESDGGAYSVNRAQPRLSDPENSFASVHGPGYRAIYDLSDLNESLFATATGQSGNLLSPFYADNTEAWRNGEYINIPQSRKDAVKGAIGVLTLIPAE